MPTKQLDHWTDFKYNAAKRKTGYVVSSAENPCSFEVIGKKTRDLRMLGCQDVKQCYFTLKAAKGGSVALSIRISQQWDIIHCLQMEFRLTES